MREVKLRERKLEEMGGRLEEKLEKATAKEHELLAAEKDLARKERQAGPSRKSSCRRASMKKSSVFPRLPA